LLKGVKGQAFDAATSTLAKPRTKRKARAFLKGWRNAMIEPELKVYARISALEFISVMVLANDLAMRSPKSSESFKAHLLSREPALPSGSGPLDAEVVQAVATMMRHDIDSFVRKVSAREADIRAKNPLDR
jgi:hypothetical protein